MLTSAPVLVPNRRTGEDSEEEEGLEGIAFDVPLPPLETEHSLDSEADGIDWRLGVSLPPQDDESDSEPVSSMDGFAEDLVRPTDESWLQSDDEGPSSSVLEGEFSSFSPLGEEGDEEGVNDPSLMKLDEVWTELSEEEAERERLSTEPQSLDVDDSELGWEKKRWHERALPLAYTPRRGVMLLESMLCLCGESTHLIHHRTCLPIDEAVACAKTTQMVALDQQGGQFLLLTATGRLMLWDRNAASRATCRAATHPSLDRVADIWQSTPGAPDIVVRLETGELYTLLENRGGTLTFERIVGDARAIGQSLLGVPRLGLLRLASREVHATVGLCESAPPLPTDLRKALAVGRPLVASDGEHWLVGVRDSGLWCSPNGGRRGQLVKGCRSITAACLGLLHERTVGFVGLFSELDDRADLAIVELATGKASRIAELRVVTDSLLGDHDSPERARIDAMAWDAAMQQLWVVGAFGVACFNPPSSPRAS